MLRSIIASLGEGDLNTKYFQAKAVWRVRKNKIKKLTDLNGNEPTDLKAIGVAATTYFENLFQTNTTLDATPIIDLFHV